MLLLWQYAENIVAYFSINFLFLTGSAHGNHGIGDVGQFYLFELPFMIAGIVGVMRQKQKWSILLFGWAILTILVASLTRDVPHATRSFFLIFPYEIFSAYGLFLFLEWISTQKFLVRLLVVSATGILVMYNLLFYFTSYYMRFPILYAIGYV
jgi:hypothetical protein